MGKLKRMVCNTVPTPRPLVYQRFRSCEWKKRYASEAKAERAVFLIKKNGSDTNPKRVLTHYKCGLCFGWHVGHTRKLTESELPAEDYGELNGEHHGAETVLPTQM